jgi:CBS domain-containing protein
MEQIKPNYFGGANFEARTVKDIIEPAKSVSNKISVRAALEQMQAQATDSSPVVDQCGELLGILSKNKMNRDVGGFGHDPETETLEAHIEKKSDAYCFEDQTIAEAEQMMLKAKLGEVFVVTREKLLVGTINIEAIAQEGKKLGSRHRFADVEWSDWDERHGRKSREAAVREMGIDRIQSLKR